MRKQGLKALGLCLVAALGLMAFGSTARAAEWTIEGVGVLKGTETIKGVATTSQLFKSKAGKAEFVMHCSELSTDDGLLYGSAEKESEGKPPGTGLATLLYKSCITKLAGVESKICKPVEPIEAKVRYLLILHEGKVYILLEPHVAGKPFFELKFGTGECSVPTTPVTGELIFQCLEPAGTQVDCKTLRVNQLISPADPTLFNGVILPRAQGMTFGTNSLEFAGSQSFSLSGANVGKPWGGTI